jgi:hypothetical protein
MNTDTIHTPHRAGHGAVTTLWRDEWNRWWGDGRWRTFAALGLVPITGLAVLTLVALQIAGVERAIQSAFAITGLLVLACASIVAVVAARAEVPDIVERRAAATAGAALLIDES